MGDINYRPLIDDMTFSYSRISTYDSCPYKWRLDYIDQYNKEEKFYASYGTLMHDILAKYYGGNISKDRMPIEFLTRFYGDVKGELPSGKIVESYIQKSLLYLRNFEGTDLHVIDVEKKVDFEIGGIKFTGFIDLIGEKDGNIIIVDHKSRDLKQRSGRVKPTLKDIELDEYLRQLYLYSKAVKDEFGKFPTELWFNCFKSGNVIKENFCPDGYEKAIKWALDTIEKIKNDSDFEANYNYFYCRWICGQSWNCDEYELCTS